MQVRDDIGKFGIGLAMERKSSVGRYGSVGICLQSETDVKDISVSSEHKIEAWTSRIRCCSEGKTEENGQEIAIDMATTKIKGKIVISKADADTEKLRCREYCITPKKL